MKKVITGLLVLLCMAALTGCGKNDISLTNEENDLVAEYIAGTLLKYSYDNEWKYQNLILHRRQVLQQLPVLTAVHGHQHRVRLAIHRSQQLRHLLQRQQQLLLL